MTTNESFSLADLSRITNIKDSTLRFYLKRFRKHFEPIKRGPFNRMIFFEKDINLLLKIRTLSKQHNLSMEEIEKSLESNKLPEISIKADETSKAYSSEALEKLTKKQKEIKEYMANNSIAIQEVMANQQIIEERQMRIIKFMEKLEKLPDSIEKLNSSFEKSKSIIESLDRKNSELTHKIDELQKKNEKLTEKMEEKRRGFFERFFETFKEWFFEVR